MAGCCHINKVSTLHLPQFKLEVNAGWSERRLTIGGSYLVSG
jgi:hypothetical protein